MIADSMKLVLTALNTTRTGYASFTFATNKFFSKFIYNPPRTSGSTKGKFTCRLYNKVDGICITYVELLLIFLGFGIHIQGPISRSSP